MAAQQVSTARSILIHATEILHRHEEIARRTGQQFNLFDLLDRATDEVKGHSAFIVELLSPTGVHGQGDRFLEIFLDRLARSAPSIWQLADAKGPWTVRAEVSFGQGQVDIVLDCATHCIVIENKIYSPEHSAQPQRYYRWARGTGRIAGVVFLPLEPTEPSKAAREELGDRLLTTDYASLVLPWINDCIGLAARVPPVREGLIQYHRLVARLTQEPEDMDSLQEITNLLDSREKLNAAEQIAAALVEKHADIQLRFWEAMKKELCQRLGLTTEDFHDEVCYDSVKVLSFHRHKSSKHPFFGLRFDIPGRAPWALKLEVNYHLYFGVVVMEDGEEKGRIPLEQKQRIKDVLDENLCHGFNVRNDEPHIVWKYGTGMENILFHERSDVATTHVLADSTVLNKCASAMAEDVVRAARALSTGWPKKESPRRDQDVVEDH